MAFRVTGVQLYVNVNYTNEVFIVRCCCNQFQTKIIKIPVQPISIQNGSKSTVIGATDIPPVKEYFYPPPSPTTPGADPGIQSLYWPPPPPFSRSQPGTFFILAISLLEFLDPPLNTHPPPFGSFPVGIAQY